MHAYLKAVQTKNSPVFKKFLTPKQFTAMYGPTPDQVTKVTQYLKSVGLHVTDVTPNNLIIHVKDTAGTLEKAFGVTLNDYTYRGRKIFGTYDKPKFPDDVAAIVSGVVGLNNAAELTPDANYGACVKYGPEYGYTASQMETAYDWPDITDSSNGSGVTIAFAEFGDYNVASATVGPCSSNFDGDADLDLVACRDDDMEYFWTSTGNGGLDHVLDFVNVDGGPSSSGTHTNDDREATADIEWAGVMAPGATLEVYSAPNTTELGVAVDASDLFSAIATDDNAQVVSISYGWYESDISTFDTELHLDEYDSFIAVNEDTFYEMTSQGQSVVSGTGDRGSSPSDDAENYCCTDDARYPSSSDNVLAVGGTVVTLNGDNAITGEVVWNTGTNGSNDGCATGGAQSMLIGPEDWQIVTGVPEAANDERINSDIAMNADDYQIYFSTMDEGDGEEQIAGNSLGTPQIAAMIALVVSDELPNYTEDPTEAWLGLPNTAIYTIGSGSDYTLAFNQTISSSSGNNCLELVGSTQTCTSSTFTAASPWGYPTGWGTPVVSTLISDIEATAY
jgi:kumamolisin